MIYSMHIFLNLLLLTALNIDCDFTGLEKNKQIIYNFQLNFKHSRALNINDNFIIGIGDTET